MLPNGSGSSGFSGYSEKAVLPNSSGSYGLSGYSGKAVLPDLLGLISRRSFFLSHLSARFFHEKNHFLPSSLFSFLTAALPFTVKRYFCVGERREFGWVSSIRPSKRAGFKYFSKNVTLSFNFIKSMISALVNSWFIEQINRFTCWLHVG